MKKAYELSTLTGTQVLLLVVSETGLVYTFTTVKLQPIVTKPEGKSLIQACLNAPDPGMEGGGVEENDAASVGSHKTATTSSTAAQNAPADNRNTQVSPKPESTSPSVVRQQVPPPGYPQQSYPTANQQCNLCLIILIINNSNNSNSNSNHNNKVTLLMVFILNNNNSNNHTLPINNIIKCLTITIKVERIDFNHLDWNE
ncbi:unnamed protein product [Cunninghamella blakesleeana]